MVKLGKGTGGLIVTTVVVEQPPCAMIVAVYEFALIPPVKEVWDALRIPLGVGDQLIVYVGDAFEGLKLKPKLNPFTVLVQLV